MDVSKLTMLEHGSKMQVTFGDGTVITVSVSYSPIQRGICSNNSIMNGVCCEKQSMYHEKCSESKVIEK